MVEPTPIKPQLRMMVSHTDSEVRIDFDKHVAWIGLPKQDALILAATLVRHASDLVNEPRLDEGKNDSTSH